MRWDDGDTNTGKAFDVTVETFEKGARDANKAIPKVVVLVTDGMPYNGPSETEEAAREKALSAAKRAKEAGIVVFMVGLVGDYGIREDLLREMASPKAEDHSYSLDSSRDLAERFPSILLNMTCRVSAAVPLTVPDISKSLEQCQSAYMRVAASKDKGITLKLHAIKGRAAMYISLTTQEPSADSNDGYTEAGDGEDGEINVT